LYIYLKAVDVIKKNKKKYYDISQKFPLFVSGAVVGESPPWAGR
jgi:hypothetical protein